MCGRSTHLLLILAAASQACAIRRILPPWRLHGIPNASPNLSNNITTPTTLQTDYPVACFNPYLPNLKTAAVEDCQFVIDYAISSYGDPWIPKTFGYTPDVDIDLNEPENSKWALGRCAVFVRNVDRTCVDTFRMVDVGAVATRILRKCVMEAKYPYGGSAQIGSEGEESRFYVALGGLSGIGIRNGTRLSQPLKESQPLND